MFRARGVAAAVACVLFASGCFEVEQTIELERDLSGRAGVRIGVNLEPMVMIMTQISREIEGKEGPATEEEIAAARAKFLEQSKNERSTVPSVEEMDLDLPEGIELLDFNVTEDELQIMTDFLFSFDQVSRLADLRLPSKGDDPTRKNVVEAPFASLDVIDEGETFTIRSSAQNPATAAKSETKSSMEVDKETEAMMEKAFRDLRVAYRITAPFEVVSHNATRVEKDTLIWEYDFERFKQMEASKESLDLAVSVTYRK